MLAGTQRALICTYSSEAVRCTSCAALPGLVKYLAPNVKFIARHGLTGLTASSSLRPHGLHLWKSQGCFEDCELVYRYMCNVLCLLIDVFEIFGSPWVA